MIEFVAEKENEFAHYYILKPKKGIGAQVRALNGQQAIAAARHWWPHEYDCMLCVIRLRA